MDEIMKLKRRQIAKIVLNRYNKLNNIDKITEAEYNQALVDAAYVINPKGKKSNPFNLVFTYDGKIDFEKSKANRREGWM